MESIRLSEYYRSMTSWPRTEGELYSAAERVAQLLDCPFAAIQADDCVVFWLASGSALADKQWVEEMLRAQFLRVGTGELKQVQILRETTPLAGVLPCKYLTFAAVPLPHLKNGIQNEPSGEKSRGVPGIIVVGSMKALADREQSLLFAAAQKFSGLWAISHLEAALSLRNQFLSIASHELKTPLTSIYGILQLQQRTARIKSSAHLSGAMPTEEEDRQTTFLKISIRQVQRLNELIDGLLDVSRIQNGRFMVDPTQTDVAVLVKETVASRLTLIADEAHISMNVESPDHFLARVDPVRLEEVVTNLVMNAIRFSPEGGVVWVRLAGVQPEGGAFRLIVRDQGPCVPTEDRERIFHPFERAQRTSRLGGLGLGLYISRQIAQLHGGNVSLVESLPGKGNAFEAYFPVSA
jgi:signal transduction histidine kinase